MDYKILNCPLYTAFGSATLGVPHPTDATKTYAFVVVVFEGGNVTDPASQCTPRQKVAEQLAGKESEEILSRPCLLEKSLNFIYILQCLDFIHVFRSNKNLVS